jgi:natural product precursor
MKTLSKIKINPERILKDEELRSLNGGGCWYCTVYCAPNPPFGGPACGSSLDDIRYTCNQTWMPAGCDCWCD